MTSAIDVIDLLDSDEEQSQQQEQREKQKQKELPSKPALLTKKSSGLSTLSNVSSSKFWDLEHDDPIESTQPHPSFSPKTIELLASLDKEKGNVKIRKKSEEPLSKTIATTKRKAASLSNLQDDISSEDETIKKSNKTSKKLTEEEKATRTLEREAKKAEKEKEKDAEKERKRLAKEEKDKQKNQDQALASANKISKSRTETVAEMICDVSSDLFDTTTGQQLQSFLTGVGSRCTSFSSPIPSIVKWRRSITAEWNEDVGVFLPISEEIRRENHILCLVSAKDFVELANDEEQLLLHVNRIKSLFPAVKVIYVIEGLAKLLSKNKSNKSRAFASAVRNRIGDGGGSNANQGRTTDNVDENKIEDALLKLQIIHKCLIYQTTNNVDSAEAISSYTQHISSVPYKNAKSALNKTTNFCMDVGQVKTGADTHDTYSKILQEVPRCTAAVANGIRNVYPTLHSLVNAIARDEDALKDVQVMHNKNGAAAGRKVGQAMSKSVTKILRGGDEWEMTI